MSDAYSRYNSDVLATFCPRCGARPRQRCRGSIAGGGMTPAHLPRLAVAGWKWDKAQKQLVRLTEG